MLESQFTPYEQALELRELDFDEECLGFWDAFKNKPYNRIVLQFSPNKYFVDNENGYCLAPTWGQIFDWFRNEKGLLNYIGFEFTDRMGMGAYSFYYVIEHDTNEAFGWEEDGFSTFEEARLECLKKLIEIVKNEIK